MRRRSLTLLLAVMVWPLAGRAEVRSATGSTTVLTDAGHAWHAEQDPASTARIVSDGRGVGLWFELGAGRPTSQFAAAVVALSGGIAGFNRLLVRATADRPLRIAIQLRRRDDLGASRWRRTMYLDRELRTAAFDLAGFTPVAPERAPAPPQGTIGALLLGVDTVNTRPGTRASIALVDVRLER